MSTMTQTEYRAHPAISQSDLKAYVANKLLYYEVRIAKTREPKPSTKQQQWGKDFEVFLRDQSSYPEFIPLPSHITQRRGTEWELYRQEVSSEIEILPPKEFEARKIHRDAFNDAMKNVMRHPEAKPLVMDAKWHSRHFWTCPYTGLDRKGELDIETNDVIVDVKTAADVSPEGFAAAAERFGYAVQLATYQEAALMKTGQHKPTIIVAIKNSEPYNVEVYKIDDAWIDEGHAFNASWMPRYKRSVENDDWLHSLSHKAAQILKRPRWGKYVHEQLEDMIDG